MNHTPRSGLCLYAAAAQIMSLIPCVMMAYVRIGTEGWIPAVTAVSAGTLLALPLMLYLLSWCIDVYLREIVDSLMRMMHGHSGGINLRRILRFPSRHALKAAAIVQIMVACVLIGMMIWPVLRRMYS